MVLAGQSDDFVGDVVGGVRTGQLFDVTAQAFKAFGVCDGVDGHRKECSSGVGVGHVERCVLLDECEGVFRLMVFGHVGRGDEDGGLAEQAEF